MVTFGDQAWIRKLRNMLKHVEIVNYLNPFPLSTTTPLGLAKWSRLHLDFAGLFVGSMYLVLVDTYSKWLEVVIMNSITSISTIEKLQQIFAAWTP